MKRHDYSIIIPTLNEEKFLPRLLASLVIQTVKDFEIIVSDGGSKDNTTTIAKKYGAKVIIHTNTTVTQARQNGLEEASGKIIVGADADTIYPHDHLDRIAKDMREDEKIVAVGGGGLFESKPWWTHWGWRITYYILGKLYQYFALVIYVPAFNLSFRKDVFLKVGGYDTKLDFGGDEIDVLKKLKTMGKVLFDIQLHPNPSSRRAKEGFWKLIVQHTLIDYYLGYILAKVFGKAIIKGKQVR